MDKQMGNKHYGFRTEITEHILCVDVFVDVNVCLLDRPNIRII